jgi:hypothetical protein
VRGVITQPTFKFGYGNELQTAPPDPSEFRLNVVVEEVPAAAKSLRSFFRP